MATTAPPGFSIPPRARSARLDWLALLYVAAVLVWNLLRLTRVGRWWPFELVDIFAVWQYALLLPLAVALALSRRWLPLIALLLPAAAFLVEYGLPIHPTPAPTGAPVLRVLTSNLLFSNGDATSLREVLVREQPDLAAVVELGPAMARAIPDAAGDLYPYRALYPSEIPVGLGLLSRYPLRLASPPEVDTETCLCVDFWVDAPGRTLHVIVAHPGPPDAHLVPIGPLRIPTSFDARQQDASLSALMDHAQPSGEPMLLLGDLNVGDRQPFYRRLRRVFGDAHRDAGTGLGFTFPNPAVAQYKVPPVVRIDYVLYGSGIHALASHTGTLRTSDHLYVVADLAVDSSL